MNLTRNFTLQELTKSDTAIRKGIINNPNADQVEKLKVLCEEILQTYTNYFGGICGLPAVCTVELCQAIGSSPNSQHAKAEACDLKCPE